MASRSRRWYRRTPALPNRRVFRAVALVVLVLLAPMGSVDESARADQPSVEVAHDGNFPRSDIQPSGTIERLHAAGVTGKNVSVGILDVTGYDTTNHALSGQVAAKRSFGPGSGVPNLGRNAHGTATASLVANVAPDAELYLASFSTQESYHDAFEWLVENDVDVVVAPVSFYGQPRDSSSNLSDPAIQATRSGTTVVAAAGNLANSYWAGTFKSDPRGRLQFDGGYQNHLVGNDSRVVIWLSWSEQTDANFSVELYREGRDEPVATSRNYTRDRAQNARLATTIDPSAEYYFVVRGPPLGPKPRITVESPTHEFEFAHQHGSVTQPAVADDVVSVGAYDIQTDAAAAYSAAGPVDHNPGVDVLGPTNLVAPGYPSGFEGTSASAAYVGGLAALVYGVDQDATPGHVESLLERSARDVGRAGPDTVNGYGVVEPEALIRLARNESTARRSADYDR